MNDNIMAQKPQSAPAGEFGGKKLNIAILAAAVLALFGVILWIVQLNGGLVQTNMRNLDSWGLYITSFMFFVGLSAGGLIISSVPKAFGMRGFGGISKVAVWTSVCCTVMAVAMVVVDLGQPLRLWELVAYSNLSSPLMWDILVITAYLALSVAYLWAMLRYEKGLVTAFALRVVSVCALVCAVLVHTVTAWIFSLQISHEFWHTALMGPWFVVSALACGTALVMVVCVALRKVGYLDVPQESLERMAKMLGAFVVVDVYFYGCDLLTSGYPGANGAEVVSMLTVGPLAPFFWLQIACSAAAAAICFVPKLRTTALMVVAGSLAIIAIFFKRVQILVGGFQIANIDLALPYAASPNLTGAGSLTQSLAGSLVYFPAPIELGVFLGVLGLGTLAFLLGLKYLPLKPVEDDR